MLEPAFEFHFVTGSTFAPGSLGCFAFFCINLSRWCSATGRTGYRRIEQKKSRLWAQNHRVRFERHVWYQCRRISFDMLRDFRFIQTFYVVHQSNMARGKDAEVQGLLRAFKPMDRSMRFFLS